MTAGTIVALSSGALPAGIAVLRLTGPDAHRVAGQLCALPPPGRTALRRLVAPGDALPIDEALVLRFDAPRSASGEDLVEFHLHGSPAIVDRMLAVLTADDAVRMAEPGEFTRRALINGKMDLIEAEALSDLLAAETEEQRRQAMQQMRGGLSDDLHRLLDMVIDLSAQAEAAIDYVGDEEEVARADHLTAGVQTLIAYVEKLLEAPQRRPLHDGVRVVFAGPPNSGKSSIFNVLVGYPRAIVSDVAGTTRDTVEVSLRLDGRAYIFVDTAGLHGESDDAIEREGIERARGAIAAADILCWFGDEREAPSHPRKLQIRPMADRGGSGPGIAVSAVSEGGEKKLLDAIRRSSDQLIPAPGEAVLNQRQTGILREISNRLTTLERDPVLLAVELSSIRRLFERLLGRETLDATLDRIFERFCLGK